MSIPKQDNSYWFSKLSDYLTCPRRYKYIHVDKIPSDYESSSALEFGSAVHHALESTFEGEDALLAFNTFWDTFKNKRQIFNDQFSWDRLNDAGETFVTRFNKKYLPKLEPILVEKRLYGKLGRYNIEGTPDCYAKYEDKLTLIDFKTSAYRYPKEKIHIADQLVLYAELLRQNGFELPEQIVYIVFVKSAVTVQTLKKDLTKEVISATLERIQDTIDAASSDKKFTQNVKSCFIGRSMCPFFAKCHGKETTAERDRNPKRRQK